MIKAEYKGVEDFKVGDNIKGFFFCKKIELKLTRLGDEYLDVLLEDKSGVIRAKVWSFASDYIKRIDEGKPVAVKGNIISYNEKLEINISSINCVDNDIYKDYGFKESLLVKCIEEDKDKLFKDLIKYIDELDGDYKKLVSKIIKDNKHKIMSLPSINFSYGLNGGLLKQIVSVLDLNKRVYPKYKELNKNIVISGIIIKNIGSVKYFNDDLQFSVSDENQYLGHKLIGINIINDYAAEYASFSKQIKNELQNLILSENSKNDLNLNYINALYHLDLSIYESMNPEEL